MLKNVFSNLIGHAIVASGRAIKLHNLKLYSDNNFDITPEQFIVLNILQNNSYSQSKLCELLLKDKSNMARLISVLEEKNLIEKKQCTENGKQINLISLSLEGEKLCSKIKPYIEKSRQQYLKDIKEDELYTCIKVLNTIKKNIDEANKNGKEQN